MANWENVYNKYDKQKVKILQNKELIDLYEKYKHSGKAKR